MTRRYLHVLCMLSDRPLLSLFKSVLRTAHALLLLRPDALAPFLARLRAPRPFPMPGESFVVRLPPPAEALSAGDEGMTWRFVRPNDADEPLADVRVLPLVRALRDARALQALVGALMCERRVVLVSASVEQLSACAHACVALLQPFEWQHVFIPLLPAKLLSYACAPM